MRTIGLFVRAASPRSLAATALGLGCCALLLAATHDPLAPGDQPPGGAGASGVHTPPAAPGDEAPPLLIGPVAGLTVGWHAAPEETAIPLGTVATFKAPAPIGARVAWRGAHEVARDAEWSTATCELRRTGMIEVGVTIRGAGVTDASCRLDVMAIDPATIKVAPISVDTAPYKIDDSAPQWEINAQSAELLALPSIAAVRALGGGVYRTSVDRSIGATLPSVDPPAFMPLMEWRIDGEPMSLGGRIDHAFPAVGVHLVETGPLAVPASIDVQTYRATIVSPAPGEHIADGAPVTFVAETDPPGFEDDITWIASTQHGATTAITASGAVFTTQFNGPWDVSPDGAFESIGVRADNAIVEQALAATDLYQASYEGSPGFMYTDLGPQLVLLNGFISIFATPPDGFGYRTLIPDTIFLDGPSAPTSTSETGGISFRLLDGSPSGTWNVNDGAFVMPLEFETHYWLIDQFVPPTPPVCDPLGETGFTANELFVGGLWGTATLDVGPEGPELNIQQPMGLMGGSITGQLGGLTQCGWPKLKLKIPAGPVGCPFENRVNTRKVCIQPVFFKTNDMDMNPTGASLPAFKAKAETVWKKCCVELEFKPAITKIGDKIVKEKAAGDRWANFRAVLDKEDAKGENDCIEVFFISEMQDKDGKKNFSGDGLCFNGGNKAAKVIVADDPITTCPAPKPDGVLAHELGHAMGNLQHPEQDPNAAGSVMEGTGMAPPACPGLNPDKVKAFQCDTTRKGPLVKEKNPKELCCLMPDP
ncbi:MAG: hypothetical protein U0575_11840 [Phycisphaerales bacterium]